MKQLCELSVSALEAGSKIIDSLCEAIPAGRKGAGFSVTLPVESSELASAMEVLAKHGLVKRKLGSESGRNRTPNRFLYDLVRTYDETDFRASHYLRLRHLSKVTDDQTRDSEGRLVIEAWRLLPGLRIGCVLFEATVVSDSLRRRMEAARLQGLEFRELTLIPAAESFPLMDSSGQIIREVKPDDRDHIEKRNQYWELTSSALLPPLDAPRVVTRDGQPFDGDYSRGIGLVDEYRPAELHYRQKDVPVMQQSDFALTYEKFPDERWPVVSQRFYRFCVAEGLKLDWIPVRIEPD